MTSSELEDLSIEELLDVYVTNRNSRSSKDARAVQDACNELFSRDYTCKLIDNTDGSYCSSYPLDLIIPERPRNTSIAPLNQVKELSQVFQNGKFARVRGRFPIPVIIWNNKNICRSATISVQAEVYLNVGSASLRTIREGLFTAKKKPKSKTGSSYDVEAQRKYDKALLSKLRIKYICDLMVEFHKVKMGMVVCSSSEKAESQLYTDFKLQPMPYPGCEFFRDFKRNNHCGQNLKFNWDCSYIDAKFVKPPTGRHLNLDWNKYRTWDIVVLTQNYFRLLMEYVVEDKSADGVLVHCISGWDRTPLFISLIRLSLWADGEIHQSLDEKEILFLTLGYDWMLFSHLLDDRLAKGEDIFYFCFYMLPFVVGREYSIKSISDSRKSAVRKEEIASDVKSPEFDARILTEGVEPSLILNGSKIDNKGIDGNTAKSTKKFIEGMQENHFEKVVEEEKESFPKMTVVQKGFSIKPDVNFWTEDETRKLKDNTMKSTWGKITEDKKSFVSQATEVEAKSQNSMSGNYSREKLQLGKVENEIRKEAGSMELANRSDVTNCENKPDSVKSASRAESTESGNKVDSAESGNNQEGYSKSRSITFRRRSRSNSEKVLVGSWQMISSDLQSNNISPDYTPPASIHPSPPILRKPLSIGEDEESKIATDQMRLSFTATMYPSYPGTMEMISQATGSMTNGPRYCAPLQFQKGNMKTDKGGCESQGETEEELKQIENEGALVVNPRSSKPKIIDNGDAARQEEQKEDTISGSHDGEKVQQLQLEKKEEQLQLEEKSNLGREQNDKSTISSDAEKADSVREKKIETLGIDNNDINPKIEENDPEKRKAELDSRSFDSKGVNVSISEDVSEESRRESTSKSEEDAKIKSADRNLERRRKRLLKVHDLFMKAYRDRILENPRRKEYWFPSIGV
mmetsp:Transcript_13316/g.19925  ORF Transcript_13316/g.19925 Transcript_13316/m.19925 type:complete len:916 (+) Transcript_13316:149-2896(+)|eukprot:CAMPEP_0167742890 /NCGR_PEP_ID=MMETSP0110_2-20121227/1699_1 /TAXON_ID=629695 /ORGANISM="Gymnochlora sp., Strain CCMP2014" /LENGTH=915 /DNA_ID=CAMNT_0007627175 /DNA_START=1126 /DNA_END=3873 /DNA_ORIENTATION=-